MSTRNEPRDLHEKIAWIEEQLRKLHLNAASIPAGIYTPGGMGGSGGSGGGSGIDHDSLLNVTEDQHHARQHALSSPLDHTGQISAAQHPVIPSGDLHPEYLSQTEGDLLYPIEALDEGGSLGTFRTVDFVGSAVTATIIGDDLTVTVTGSGSGFAFASHAKWGLP